MKAEFSTDEQIVTNSEQEPEVLSELLFRMPLDESIHTLHLASASYIVA